MMTRAGRPTISTSLLFAWVCWAATPAALHAEPASCLPARPHDEVWLIDARKASRAVVAPGRMPYFKIARFSEGAWKPSDMKSLLAGAEQLPHIIWVHGNRIETGEARQEGLAVYRALVAHAADSPPIRFIIWSWPAGQTHGPIKDARLKAERSEPAGYQLAWLLDRLPGKTQVGLVGFSFGARIITGALQLLSGGGLENYYLVERKHPERPPVRVVSWAAALDRDWLLPGEYHGEALSQIDKLLLLNNSCDRALRRYYVLDKYTRPVALGAVGLAARPLGPESAKVAQCDVCSRVGRVHSSDHYVHDPLITGRTWRALMGPSPVAVASKQPSHNAAVSSKKPVASKKIGIVE